MIEDPKQIIEADRSGRLQKILLVRISRLGDLIFTTPAIRGLKARFPRAEIHFLTNPYSCQALEGNPYIHRVHLMDRKRLLWRCLRIDPVLSDLKRIGFDLAIFFRWRNEFSALSRKIDAPLVYKVASPEGLDDKVHQADRYMAGLSALGVEPDNLGMDVFFNNQDTAEVQQFLEKHDLVQKPFSVIHAGCHQILKKKALSGSSKRTWPLTHWINLVDSIGKKFNSPPVLVGFSQGDRMVNSLIMEGIGDRCPEFFLSRTNQLAALLRRAAGFVCLDTGPLHVASAVGAPTVALFGPSRPALTGPYRNRRNAKVLQKNLPCVPCKGNDIKCTNNVCMQLITPDEVVQALIDLKERIETGCA